MFQGVVFQGATFSWEQRSIWQTNQKHIQCKSFLCHDNSTDEHFALQIILLPAWTTLLPNSLCFSTQFTHQHFLLFSTLCTSAHFAPQHTLLPGKLCSQEHFTPWNTLLPGTLCFKCSREQRMLRRTIYKLAKCSKEQSVPGSKVC